ncbi:MAG TPA: peptide chain release factor N(5)-glutamine methyltransferase [Bacteroidota bacterium]|nr:peptide chain release factor N(5)-glutamine methyltransferase [Bacteroidota bacterium]
MIVKSGTPEDITIEENTAWTVKSLLQWGSNRLTSQGIESTDLTCELFLSHVLQCSRIDLHRDPNKSISSNESAQFKDYIERRCSREPVQYILGECEFMGLRFRVDPRVLIPRPETEILVQEVIDITKSQPIEIKNILDIGTGSGNIAISLAKFLPNCRINAIDVSYDALEMAWSNIRMHEVQHQVNLMHADFLGDDVRLLDGEYDVIVSNPPYISRVEFQKLEPEISSFEPAIATTDNSDGLTFFRAIAQKAQSLIQPEGFVFVEMAYGQKKAVEEIFQLSGFDEIGVISDYNKIERVLRATRR